MPQGSSDTWLRGVPALRPNDKDAVGVLQSKLAATQNILQVPQNLACCDLQAWRATAQPDCALITCTLNAAGADCAPAAEHTGGAVP